MLFIRSLFIRDANRPHRIDDHDHGTNDENQKIRMAAIEMFPDFDAFILENSDSVHSLEFHLFLKRAPKLYAQLSYFHDVIIRGRGGVNNYCMYDGSYM